jgi:DNA-binding transcriptional MerR regulator
MEYRVEALAANAGVSVDTIRFYQARGLLPTPRRVGRVALYGDEHLERLSQIKHLQQRGFSLGVIGRLLRGDLDAADEALLEAVVVESEADKGEPEEFLTLGQLAERAGVPAVLLEALEREGVLVPRRQHGDARYTEADLVALRAGLTLLEYGLPLSDVLDLARLHQAAARQVAERAVTLFDQHVRQVRRDSGTDDAAQLVDAFHALLPATVSLVAHNFRRILLAVAQEYIEANGDEEERAAVLLEAEQRLEPPIAVQE